MCHLLMLTNYMLLIIEKKDCSICSLAKHHFLKIKIGIFFKISTLKFFKVYMKKEYKLGFKYTIIVLPRNVGFLENFAYVLNEWSLLIASAYLYWTFEFISFNSFITEVPTIKEPSHWFALEINEPVSIWLGQPSWKS